MILGAGYAGVTLTRRLESTLPPDVDLVVVEASETHLVKHEVHRVIRRPAVADAIRVPLSALFDRATVRTGRVTGLDRDARTVHLDGGDDLDYDYAAVCLGSVTADYGIPGVAEHGLPLLSVEDASEIRAAFRSAAGIDADAAGDAEGRIAVEDADEDADEDRTHTERGPPDAGEPTTPGSVDAVVGGAGLSGVQTAGELAALAHEEACPPT